MTKLLASGRVRRSLVSVKPSERPNDTESALRMLLLSSLQVEPETSAPWSLPPTEIAPPEPPGDSLLGGGGGGGGGACN